MGMPPISPYFSPKAQARKGVMNSNMSGVRPLPTERKAASASASIYRHALAALTEPTAPVRTLMQT